MSLLDTFKKTTFGAAANAATEQEVRDLSSDCKTPVLWYGDNVKEHLVKRFATMRGERYGVDLKAVPGYPSDGIKISICNGISEKTYADKVGSGTASKAIAAQERVGQILSGEYLNEPNLQMYEEDYPGIQVRKKLFEQQASTKSNSPTVLATNMQPQ